MRDICRKHKNHKFLLQDDSIRKTLNTETPSEGGESFYQTIMSNKAVYKKNRSEGLMGYYYYYRWEKLILIEMNVMKRSFEFDDIPINIFIYKPIVFVSLFTFI